jgi:UDP-2-acetamido-2,6-beta-L-arabino-hexul-4-ose reductase
MRIGITGESGFIGSSLKNYLSLNQDINIIKFNSSYFDNFIELRKFVKECDVIIHLAAKNRHDRLDELFNINIDLVKKLIEALEIENTKPHVYFASSTQEKLDNPYGCSKKIGQSLLENWAKLSGANLTSLIIPNVFGPFCKPDYNSFIATFAFKLCNGEMPQISNDKDVDLIFVDSLSKYIIQHIYKNIDTKAIIETLEIPADFTQSVSNIFKLFNLYKKIYIDNGIIPDLRDRNEVNLFNTFRSYINHKLYFPVTLKKSTDERGIFVETIKLMTGGQISFSTTEPTIIRGNHFHTRKIERFIVIKGEALIQLKKYGQDNILEFNLDGNNPSYVDIPVWHSHNIKNIGESELYTLFWINEFYDESDSDTFINKI